jgi:predicted ATPase
VGENGSGSSRCCTDLAEAGSQAVVAAHSPILAAAPGARILELGGWGMRPVS